MKYFKFILPLAAIMSLGFTAERSAIDFSNRALVKYLGKHELSLEMFEELTPNSPEYKINGKYFALKQKYVSNIKYIYIGRVNSCRAGGCSVSNSSSYDDSNSEYFDYFMLFDKDKYVQQVKVFNYKATHGYEITAKGWLNQFVGYSGSEPLRVNKNVDSISGATISVYAITGDIEVKTELLKKFTE